MVNRKQLEKFNFEEKKIIKLKETLKIERQNEKCGNENKEKVFKRKIYLFCVTKSKFLIFSRFFGFKSFLKNPLKKLKISI